MGVAWEVTAGALLGKGGVSGFLRPSSDPAITAKGYRAQSAKGEGEWGTVQRKPGSRFQSCPVVLNLR